MSTTESTPTTAPALGDLRFHRLLVALDGSENAELALNAAVNVARRDHAALTIMSVSRDVAMDAARWPGMVSMPESQDEADAYAQGILDDTVSRIPPDVGVTTVVRRGKAAREILAVLDEGTYDAILLGARGLGRVAMLMGSVSREVLHHANVAVFIAHAPRAEAVAA
ncbi:MAG TPA: universal stress protein [Solirubrobacteraceae bacterium]